MSKFETILTTTGDDLLQKRAQNLAIEAKDEFDDKKREIEKRLRNIENEIITMEDLSIRSTQSLIVGENLNTKMWVQKRINLNLERRDLQIELDEINKLMAEYFE